MTAIQNLTGYSVKQQTDIQLKYFVKYCAIKSHNDEHLQALLINKRLHNWFYNQVKIAQSNYLSIIMQMGFVRKHVAIDLYHGQMHTILTKYNKRILAHKPRTNKPLTLLN